MKTYDCAWNVRVENPTKVILSREISREPELLIIVQPTVDRIIEAIDFIHRQVFVTG